MTTGERVLVVGGGHETTQTERPPAVHGSTPWFLLVLLALFVALVVFVATPRDRAPTAVDPSGLEAPIEPPRAINGDTATLVVPDLATGWKEVRLFGEGSAVTSVAYGPDGWLAVSNDTPVVAQVSHNAVLWEAHTVHGLVTERPIAAVGEGAMAVFGVGGTHGLSSPRTIGAVSSDGGETWSPVEHAGALAISDVEVAGPRVFVGGEGGSEILWEVIDGALESIDVDARAASAVAALVVDEADDVVAFGHDGSVPTMWVSGRAVEAVGLVPTQRFIDVERVPDGFAAVIGDRRTHTASLFSSPDGETWIPMSGDQPSNLTSIDLHNEQLLGTVLSDGRIWVQGDGTILGEYPDLDTGWESIHRVLDIDSDGTHMVMVGYGGSGGALHVRGTLVHVATVARVDAGEPKWHAVATATVEVDEFQRQTLGVASTGTVSLVAATPHVFQVVETEDGMTLEPALSGAANMGVDHDGVWVWTNGSQPRLYRYRAEGLWAFHRVPIQNVESVGEVGGDLVVTGWRADGPSILRQGRDGDWTRSSAEASQLVRVERIGAGFIGLRLGPGDAPDAFAADVVASEDGVAWEPVDGWHLRGAGHMGAPSFLVNKDDPSVVALIDRWPAMTIVDTPVADPEYVVSSGDTLMVSTYDAIYLRDGEEGWARLPLELERGIVGPTAMIPGPVPRLAMLHRDRLSIVEWR